MQASPSLKRLGIVQVVPHISSLLRVLIGTQSDFWPGPISFKPLLVACGRLACVMTHLLAHEVLCQAQRASPGQIFLLITILYPLSLIRVMKSSGIPGNLKEAPWKF